MGVINVGQLSKWENCNKSGSYSSEYKVLWITETINAKISDDNAILVDLNYK